MSTFTLQTKNNVTFSNQSKNSATFSNSNVSDRYQYITTDTPDFVYVGSSENEVLIFNQPATYTNLTKN